MVYGQDGFHHAGIHRIRHRGGLGHHVDVGQDGIAVIRGGYRLGRNGEVADVARCERVSRRLDPGRHRVLEPAGRLRGAGRVHLVGTHLHRDRLGIGCAGRFGYASSTFLSRLPKLLATVCESVTSLSPSSRTR